MPWQKKLQRSVLGISIMVLSGCVLQRTSPLKEQRAQEMVDRGTILLRRGMYDHAEAAFRVALDQARVPAAYDGLGCALFLRGKPLEAESIYLKVITWFPRYAPAKANLALLYDMRGERSKALSLYEEALAQDPMNFKVRNNYGALLSNSQNQRGKSLGKSYLTDAQVIVNHPIVRANLEAILYSNSERRE